MIHKKMGEVSLDELELVIGGAGGINDDTERVSCPHCGIGVSIPLGKQSGTCPDCGRTVSKKKNNSR